MVEASPRGSDILVIHPGSRWIRIGRATDAFPVSVPHVLARKVNSNHKPPPQLSRVLKTNLDEDAMETDEIQEITNPAEVRSPAGLPALATPSFPIPNVHPL